MTFTFRSTLASACLAVTLLLGACGTGESDPAPAARERPQQSAGEAATLNQHLVDLLPSIERDYPAFFPEAQSDRQSGPYTYRVYSNGNAVGFDSTSIWAMGPVVDSLSVPVQVVTLQNHCNAHPVDCGALVTRELVIAGLTREYLVYAPWRARGVNRPPAVFVVHGSAQGGRYAYDNFGWKQLADAEGFFAVFPFALTHCFNEDTNKDGRIDDSDDLQIETKWATGTLGVTGLRPLCNDRQLAKVAANQPGLFSKANHALADDFEFFRQMVEVMTLDYAADPKRLYLSGFSNGAEMTHGLVARMSTLFAAAHLAAGTNIETMLPVATRPMSVLYSTGVVSDFATLPIDVDITVPPAVVPNMAERQVAIARTVSIDPVRHAFAGDQTVLLGSRRVDYSLYQYNLSTAPVAANNSFSAVLIDNLAHEYPSWLAAPVWAFLKPFSLP